MSTKPLYFDTLTRRVESDDTLKFAGEGWVEGGKWG